MATPEDRELNAKMMAFAETIGKGDAKVRQSLEKMIDTSKDELEAYADHLKKMRSWDTKEGQQKLETLLRLKKIEDQESTVRQEFNTKYEKYVKGMTELQTKEAAAAAAMVKAKASNNLKQQERYQKELDAVQQKAKGLQDSIEESRVAFNVQSSVMNKASAERKRVEADQLKKTTIWGDQSRSALQNVMESSVKRLFSSADVGKAIREGVSAVSLGAKTGGYGMAVNPFGSKTSVFGAAAMGLSPTEFIKMQAEMRRTILSTSGGLNTFVGGLKLASSQYKDIITDPAERTAVAAQQLEMFTKSGIRIVKEDAIAFGASMQKVAQVSGMAPLEFNSAMSSILDDESTQQRLKAAANEEDRRAIIKGTAEQFANSKAMGLTTEQAIAASKALNKLAGKGPLERYKQAAQVRAYGAAMGMGDEANQAASIISKGQRATPEEQAQLQATLGKMSGNLSKTATGDERGEIFATTLADKLQLSTLLGPSSEFNTSLAQAVSPLKGAEASMTKLSNTLIDAISTYQSMSAAVTKNPIITGAAGLAAGLTGKRALSSAASKVGEMFGKGGGAAAGEAGAAGSEVSTLAKVAGKSMGLLTKAAKVLGPVGAIAGGAFEGYDEYQQNGKAGAAVGKGVGAAAGGGLGAWGGAAAGAAIGSVVPVVGTAIGAIIGGLAGGLGGGWLGGKAGKSTGSMFDTSSTGQSATDSPTVVSSQEIATATKQTSDGITNQLAKMNESNDYLKTIAESVQRSADLHEQMAGSGSLSAKMPTPKNDAVARVAKQSNTQYDYLT